MSEQSTFGQVYHTKDGKTVFIDSKTNQALIFEGILTLDKIVEPNTGLITTAPSQVLPILNSILGSSNGVQLDLLVLTDKSPNLSKNQEGSESFDILGSKNYFILTPDKVLPLAIEPGRVPAWVSEFHDGHKPDYPGFHKHRILPEQWDWLGTHKNCHLVAWYGQECPVFVSLGCQDHGKIIRPVIVPEKTKNASTEDLMLELGSIPAITEDILAEERDV